MSSCNTGYPTKTDHRVIISCYMMTSSNGNIFRVTSPLRGEFTGHRWIPLTKASNQKLLSFLWSAPEQTVEQAIDAVDLRRHYAYYDIILMIRCQIALKLCTEHDTIAVVFWQMSKTIRQLTQMDWTNEISRDLIIRWFRIMYTGTTLSYLSYWNKSPGLFATAEWSTEKPNI